MRAWAILMMLQGHFVDGLLDNAFRDNGNMLFSVWKYFRGITAPVFFTVSGFIFTYLLVRGDKTGWENPRVAKGIRRGLQLLIIGYLLRMNLFGLLSGEIYDSFLLVDVLHCIGLSILGIIGIYLLTQRRKWVFPILLMGASLVLFLFEPIYSDWNLVFLPDALANYFTHSNGSVFTIFPWFGYAAFGAFLSILFTRFKDFRYLYPVAIGIASLVGMGLVFYSSILFLELSRMTGVQLFADIYFNNYLFIRLGDVFLVFAVFMLFRGMLKNATLLKIGQNTLSIYVIHFIILYGSFTGMGLYRFFNHSVSPITAIVGALAFMVACSYLALQYDRHGPSIKSNTTLALRFARSKSERLMPHAAELLKTAFSKALRLFGLAKG